MSKKIITSLLGTVLTVLLFAALIMQSVFYISLVQGKRDGSLPQFPESEMKLLANDISERNQGETSFLFPYFVGVISSDGMYAGSYDDSSAYEIFSLFAKVLENSPGGTAKKVVFSETEKKYEYLDSLYNSTDNCYYVKFRNGIEFSVICQLVTDTYAKIPENPDFVISDMFLISGLSGQASIIAVDPYGNVLKIFPSKNIPFNNEYLQTYNNTEKEEFEFLKIKQNVGNNRNSYCPAFKFTKNYSIVESKPIEENFYINIDSSDLLELVNIFGMNADNTKFYRRSVDDAILCVEDTTSFEITADGNFKFTSGEDGGKLSSFFENSDIVDYTFFDYVSVGRKIADSLNQKMKESYAVLSLEGITYNLGECSFYYNYTIDGVPIENTGDHALELRFISDSLVYAEGQLEIMAYVGESKTEIPQRIAYVLMDKVSGPVLYFGPEYCFEETEEEQRKAFVRWTIKTESNDRGDRQ